MSDKDYRLIMMGKNIVKKLFLCFRIQRTRRLIKKHDGTVSQQCTCNGNTLRLSFTQSTSRFAA